MFNPFGVAISKPDLINDIKALQAFTEALEKKKQAELIKNSGAGF